MWQDPIVTEVRRTREAHAAKYNFDLQAMFQALKEQEEKSRHEKVSFAPKRITPSGKEIKPALAD